MRHGERPKGIRFRPGRPSDARSVASVIVTTWRESFSSIIPEPLLRAMEVEERAELIHDRFASAFYGLFVAEDPGESVVGVSDIGEPREPRTGFSAELYDIYILPRYQRLGVGKELFFRAVGHALQAQRASMFLQVLEISLYRSFYERMGGTVIDTKPHRVDGHEYDYLIYGWSNLADLADRLTTA